MKETNMVVKDSVAANLGYVPVPIADGTTASLRVAQATTAPLRVAQATRAPLGIARGIETPFEAARRIRARLFSPKMRFWLRTLLWLAAGGLALYVLLPRIGELQRAWEALRAVRWPWLVPGVFAVASTYLWAGLALKGAVNHPVSLVRTALVQLAGSFVNKFTPTGIGGIGVNQRYLEHTGAERPVAVAGIALNLAAGVVVHVLSLSIVSALLGRSVMERVTLPDQWPLLAALAVATLSLGLAFLLRSPVIRHKVAVPVLIASRGLLEVLRSPSRAVALFVGVAGVTAVNIVTLTVTLQAVGAQASVFSVATVYLGGQALASAQPTPGNLGAIEAALVAGLATQGIQTGPALAGVMIYRLLAFWMPIVPGFLALRYLQNREVL